MTNPTPPNNSATPNEPKVVLASSVELLEKTMKELLPKLWLPMRASLATVATLRLRDLDLCPSMVLMGPSSVGKGTIIKMLDTCTGIVRVDSITPQCFVSGHANTDTSPDVRKKDILPLIRHRVMLTKDTATIFGQNSDQLKKLFGVLVPILDGDGYAPAFGTHGIRGEITGHCIFVWVLASLPWAAQTWEAHTRFGSRLGFYNLFKSAQMSDDEVLAERDGDSLSVKVATCRTVVNAVLARIFTVKPDGTVSDPLFTVAWEKDALEIARWRVKFARFLSACRKQQGWFGNVAQVEEEDEADPQRAISFLEAMMRGNAMLDDRTVVTFDDMPLAVHYTLSGSQFGRVLTALAHHPDGLSVAQCMKFIGKSETTAKNYMDAVVKQGIASWEHPKIVVTPVVGAPTQRVLLPVAHWSWLCELKDNGWLSHSTPLV